MKKQIISEDSKSLTSLVLHELNFQFLKGYQPTYIERNGYCVTLYFKKIKLKEGELYAN
ncbi:hypothetical protein [Globicatella sanguinis]|uniref:hypothetical protein n=1 Tax=Globicatella sanguinis TaxID=13076 RepID=UPI00254326DC|nr:hypothetical protein [Globicatella sanguinis]MDK7631605.1 hypothetical protein [Globicatella sanguinis]WIK66439.1 hypothetical protein CYJ72_011070 [Globicatella sanguinis]WKT55844.1 hypothetical protein Q3C38_11070 [Globicatella sanguinis]